MHAARSRVTRSHPPPAQRNGDAAPSIAVLIKGNRAPGEVSLLSCFRVESPGTPVDSRALLFFVNDLCALTIEASRRLGLALDVCVDSATKWLVPQFIVIAAAQAKVLDDLPEQDRKVVNKLTLRAAVSAQTELLGNLVVHSGVVVAALADLAASGVSPGAAACAAQVRAAMGASAGRSFDSPPLAVTIAGFVRELAALTCWLEAFDPSATFAVPARSVEEGAWVMTQEDPACGKILAMPGTCGIAGSGGVGVLYAPVGPLYVRRDSIKAAGGITVPPLAQRALQAAWAAPSNAMGQLAVLPVGIADPDVSIAAASAPLGREKGADGAGGGHVFTASTPAFTPGAPEITFDPFAGSSAAPPPPLQPPPPQAAAAAAIADELALVLGSTVAPSPALGPGPGMHAAVTGEGAQLAGGAAAADPAAEIAAHQSEYL